MPGTVGFSSQGFQGGCWNNRALGWEEFHGLNHGLIPRSQGVQLAGPESQPWAPPCGNPSSGPQRDMCLHLLAHLCDRAWCILGTLPVEKSFVAKIPSSVSLFWSSVSPGPHQVCPRRGIAPRHVGMVMVFPSPRKTPPCPTNISSVNLVLLKCNTHTGS